MWPDAETPVSENNDGMLANQVAGGVKRKNAA